jgi:recombination associated protein RdgC
MFKNAKIFRLPEGEFASEQLASMLADMAATRTHTECGPHDGLSIGWVPPREKDGPLVELVAGQIIMKAAIEKKKVPPLAIERWVARQVASMVRKPGKKELRELKENAAMALLPQAFPTLTEVFVWFDRANGLVVMDTASAGVSDDVFSLIVKTADLFIQDATTQTHPVHAMADWLVNGCEHFQIGDRCELDSMDDNKARVKVENIEAEKSFVVERITDDGMMPVGLELTLEGSASFYLTQEMTLKAIEYPAPDAPAEGADSFDADVALATGELGKVIHALVLALGGWVK